MKFPRLLFAQAIINIPVLLVYGLIGGIISFNFVFGDDNEGFRVLNVMYMTALLAIDLSFVTGIVLTVLLFRKSKYSYGVFLAYVLAVLIPYVMLYLGFFGGHGVHGTKDNIILAIMAVYPVWLIFQSVRPYHIKWARTQGKMSAAIFNYRVLIPLAVITLIPLFVSLAVNRIGISEEISEVVFTSSSSENTESNYNIANVHDGSENTSWSPRYGDGVEEWIRIDITSDNTLPVAEICIVADALGRNGRPGDVLVETSDGSGFIYKLKDSPSLQSIPIKEKNYKWIKLTFKSVYPGNNPVIGISELSLYGKLRDKISLGF